MQKKKTKTSQIDVGDWMRQLDDTVTENAAANEEIIQQVGQDSKTFLRHVLFLGAVLFNSLLICVASFAGCWSVIGWMYS